MLVVGTVADYCGGIVEGKLDSSFAGGNQCSGIAVMLGVDDIDFLPIEEGTDYFVGTEVELSEVDIDSELVVERNSVAAVVAVVVVVVVERNSLEARSRSADTGGRFAVGMTEFAEVAGRLKFDCKSVDAELFGLKFVATIGFVEN
jgi:hypothetical protein